jgi:hypothetical protein
MSPNLVLAGRAAPRMTLAVHSGPLVVAGCGVIPLACPRDARPPPGRQTEGLFDGRAAARHGEAQATGMTPLGMV